MVVDQFYRSYRQWNAKYDEVCRSLNLDQFPWLITIIILLIVIPVAISLLQIAVLTLAIPQEVTLQYLYLNFSYPNPSSMFFSNYIHHFTNPAHLIDNLSGYFVTVFLILGFYLVVLPLAKARFPALQFRFNPSLFLLTFIIYFTLLPFAISGMSITFGRILGNSGTSGFSGIVWAFTGYLTFLMVRLFGDLVRAKAAERGWRRGDDYILLFFPALAITLFIFAILIGLRNPNEGVFSHLTGFLLGYLIPINIGPIVEANRISIKRMAFVMLIGMIVIMTGIWIIL